jgi:uncharacterized membrane protein YsdA (DUF1294 family)
MVRPGLLFSLFQLGISLAVMLVASFYYRYPVVYGYLGGINLATFATMGTDKLQSRRSRLRVPEWTVLFAALIGGVGGVYSGMWVFRHKTQKSKFIFYLVLITFVQMLLVINFGKYISELLGT